MTVAVLFSVLVLVLVGVLVLLTLDQVDPGPAALAGTTTGATHVSAPPRR
jgi:hypothetical protein